MGGFHFPMWIRHWGWVPNNHFEIEADLGSLCDSALTEEGTDWTYITSNLVLLGSKTGMRVQKT